MSDVREQFGDHSETLPAADAAEKDARGERTSQETRVRNGIPTNSAASQESAAPGDDPEVAAEKNEDDDEDDDEGALEGEAEIAADYLEELLDIADLDGDIDTYIEGNRAHVSIVSESTVLVGDRGEVLEALQELTRLAVMTETGDRSRLMLDVAGFRERRREQLLSSASAAIEQARTTNTPVPMTSMNPFERKIVHDAVASAGLSSASEGDEPDRHVVVHPTA